MTFLEKLKQEHPESVGGGYLGGVMGCPHQYGYEKEDDRPCENQSFQCDDCWNREMPEQEQEDVPGATEKEAVSAGQIELMRDKSGYTPANAAAHDPVNHPAHYTAGGIECIDAIAAALTCQKDPMEAWLTGQVLKYLWRWPLKNGKEDLEKARWYLDRLIGKVGEQA